MQHWKSNNTGQNSITVLYDGAFYVATFPESVENVTRYFIDGKIPRYVLNIIQQSVPEHEYTQEPKTARLKLK